MSDPNTEPTTGHAGAGPAGDPVGDMARELCAEFCPSATDGPCSRCTAEKEANWRKDAKRALASAEQETSQASGKDPDGLTGPRQVPKPLFVVFDLDGTLALTEHRADFLAGPGPRDWRAFYAACDKDGPNHPIIATLLALDAAGHDIAIWSGRSDEVEDKTTAWLEEQGLGHIPIRTRAAGDHRPDTILKAEWLDEGRTPDLVFEDRASVVALWRSRGIVCCQVAPGNF